MSDYRYKITERLAVLSQTSKGATKEVNIVQWGNYIPMVDIRRWRDGYPLKGITLTDEEARELLR